MSKIIFVSSRLPYEIYEENGELKYKESVSGLVTGVQAIFKDNEGIWCGWAGVPAETARIAKHLTDEWAKKGYYTIDLESDLLTDSLESFCNRSLWSLFHYFLDFVDFERSEWESYKEYNRRFAECVISKYEDGDIIFVNDFQLMLVPQIIRKVRPNAKIAYFHHITFPTSDVFERLPVAQELIEGVLGADYAGFHTKGHVKAFERSVKRMGLEMGRTTAEANPIGVDVGFWEGHLQEDYIQFRAKWMKTCFQNKKIILATERLDYTKGIKERLKAYDYLLTKYPHLKGAVMLVQIAVHSRINVPLYQTIGKEVDEAIGRLKGKYEGLDWRPIYYSNRGFSQKDLCALYSISEVGCITPTVDGLNLVSKEYVISGDDNRALVLSKFAGAADELTEAYIVNPYDYEEMGEAMYRALNEPNVAKLKPVVRENSIFNWAERMLEAMK